MKAIGILIGILMMLGCAFMAVVFMEYSIPYPKATLASARFIQWATWIGIAIIAIPSFLKWFNSHLKEDDL